MFVISALRFAATSYVMCAISERARDVSVELSHRQTHFWTLRRNKLNLVLAPINGMILFILGFIYPSLTSFYSIYNNNTTS